MSQHRFTSRLLNASAALAALASLAVAAPTASARTDPNSAAPAVAVKTCPSGVTTMAVTPARGFDPLTATDSQLLANNLPPRPTGAKALKLWTKFVTTAKAQLSCDIRIGHPGSTNRPFKPGGTAASNDCANGSECDSANWSGNIAIDANYYDAYGTWVLPHAGGTGGASEYSCTWVGIGQGLDSSHPLVQAGSESDNSYNIASYYLWVEEVPQESQVVLGGSGANYGDTIWVHIHFASGSASMTVEDENTAFIRTVSVGGGISTDNTAEWIYERTEESGIYPQLVDAPPTFTGAEARSSATGEQGIGNLPHYYARMWNCTSAPRVQLAQPNAITNNGTTFSNTFNNEGTASSVNGCTVW